MTKSIHALELGKLYENKIDKKNKNTLNNMTNPSTITACANITSYGLNCQAECYSFICYEKF